MAAWSTGTAAVETVKVALVAAAAIVTEDGVDNLVLVFVTVTPAPPVGAAADSWIVQVLEAFCPIVVGLQVNEEIVTGGTRVMVV
jgi:hypothetical protein